MSNHCEICAIISATATSIMSEDQVQEFSQKLTQICESKIREISRLEKHVAGLGAA